jgi:hypothetical protein
MDCSWQADAWTVQSILANLIKAGDSLAAASKCGFRL